MKWEHCVSLPWMRARQSRLCASDVRKLVPFTATGRPKSIGFDDRLKVYAEKKRLLTLDDCMSYGAAARGHEMEPYAIADLNRALEEDGIDLEFEHWDDIVIANDEENGLGFSPDGMTIAMPKDGTCKMMSYQIAERKSPADTLAICEIKSYSAEKHLLAGYSDPKDLEERWQIATAMATCLSIDYAYLAFFNPSIEDQLFYTCYSRKDLMDEIDTVNKIEEDWLKFVVDMENHGPVMNVVAGDPGYEQYIISQIEERNRLNP